MAYEIPWYDGPRTKKQIEDSKAVLQSLIDDMDSDEEIARFKKNGLCLGEFGGVDYGNIYRLSVTRLDSILLMNHDDVYIDDYRLACFEKKHLKEDVYFVYASGLRGVFTYSQLDKVVLDKNAIMYFCKHKEFPPGWEQRGKYFTFNVQIDE